MNVRAPGAAGICPFTAAFKLLTGMPAVLRRGTLAQFSRVLPVMASNEQFNEKHRATYESFTSFTKWGTIFVVTVVLALYLFLV